MLGGADELHGAVVHVDVLKLDIRIALGDVNHDPPPELGGFEHIGLVHRRDFAASFAGGFERHFGDAPDLGRRVHLGVDAFLTFRGLLDALGFPEIDAARELAHDQDVEPLDDLAFERGGIGQHRIEFRGTQVRIQAKLFAEAQQRPFRSHRVVEAFPFGAADGAEQDRVAFLGQSQGVVRQRPAGLVDCRAPDVRGLKFEAMAKARRDRFQHMDGLRHDFRADAVAGKHCNRRLHGLSIPVLRA